MTNNNTNDSRVYTIYVKPKKIQISTDNSRHDVKIKPNLKLKKIVKWKNQETENQTTIKSEIIKTKQNEVNEKTAAEKQIGQKPKVNNKSLQNLKLSLKSKELKPTKTIRNSISQNNPNRNTTHKTKSVRSSLNSDNIFGTSTIKHRLKFPLPLNDSNRKLTIKSSEEDLKFQLHSKPNFQYHKGKIEKCFWTDPEAQMSDIFRSAVAESGSPNFRENNRLPKLVSQALKQKIPWHVIVKTLQECGADPIININCFLIQLRFHKKLSLICSIRSENIMSFKKSLMSILKRHKTSYESVLSHFYSSAMIEALSSYCTVKDFAKFERNLAKDAVDCGAKAIKILDYETGLVNFQCHPLELPAMVDELQKNKYRILYTDYGFRPLDCVDLDREERKEYTRFLCDLRKYKEIENCYDNLAPLVRETEEKVQKIKETKL